MKDKKNMVLSIIAVLVILLVIVGATYAYFTAQTGAGAGTNVNVTTGTTDNLTFNTEGEIYIDANIENFGKDDDNLSGSASAMAILRANNTTYDATANYYLYLDISNDFEYTTSEETAELILTIIDPNGNEVTEIDGLNYVTVGEVSGFDVTTKNGLITLADNYEITTNDVTTHEWNIELTFVNLDSDQEGNTGKAFLGELLIQKDEIVPVTLASHIISQYGTNKALYYHDENLENGAGDNSYRYSGVEGYNVVPEHADEYFDIDSIVKWHCDLPDTTELVNQLKEQYPQADVNLWEYSDEGSCFADVLAQYIGEDENGEEIWEEYYSEVIEGTGYWYVDYDKNIQYEFEEEAVQKVVDDGYVYTIDNYVCFGTDNEECWENLYRIIGVFDNRVKLMKNTAVDNELLGIIGSTSWTGYLWSESILNQKLNSTYLTNLGKRWSNMIASTRWSVNGLPESLKNATSPKVIFDAEMTYDAEYTAKVGLQYVSDAAYAVAPNKWANDFSYSDMGSWMSNGSFTLSISRVSDSDFPMVYFGAAKPSGKVLYAVDGGVSVSYKPVFYLLESVEYKSGTGTLVDPYRIS